MVSFSFSGNELRKAWRYAIKTDFHSISDPDRPVQTTTVSPDSYTRSIPLVKSNDLNASTPSGLNINRDGTKAAVPRGGQIDVYDLETGDRVVLSGHVGAIRTVSFAPCGPNTLVSSGSADPEDKNDDDAEIIVWDLCDYTPASSSPSQKIDVEELAEEALSAIGANLKRHGAEELQRDEQDSMTPALHAMLKRFKALRSVPSSSRLPGRLLGSFQSPIFGNCSDRLILLPGGRPESNGDEAWDIVLRSLGTKKEMTLSGHRDAIMWVGFSPDDTLVASVCWDETVRIWDASTGTEKWKFITEHQNWTGAFSPDSKRFLATDGQGIVRIWDLESGEEIARNEGRRWSRAVDWSPDGRWAAVGAENMGEIFLFDMGAIPSDGKLEPAQTRILSLDQTDLSAEKMSFARGMLAVETLRFLPASAGLVLVHRTSPDRGLMVVNLKTGAQLRISPAEGVSGESKMEGQAVVLDWAYLESSKEIIGLTKDRIGFWKLP